jgi:hypothetical protein
MIPGLRDDPLPLRRPLDEEIEPRFQDRLGVSAGEGVGERIPSTVELRHP